MLTFQSVKFPELIPKLRRVTYFGACSPVCTTYTMWYNKKLQALGSDTPGFKSQLCPLLAT